MRTASDWCRILMECHVSPTVAVKWGDVFADVVGPDTFSAGDLDIESFLGQILHESCGLTKLVENMNYSAERLTVVWPGRFHNKEVAKPFANNPRGLANYVYGRRMGNTEPNDGYDFRGRTPIMLTGKDAYIWMGNLIGQDLATLPELAEQPRYALEISIRWWEGKIPDSMLGDPEKITRRVNGGLIGLAEREELTDLAGSALA